MSGYIYYISGERVCVVDKNVHEAAGYKLRFTCKGNTLMVVKEKMNPALIQSLRARHSHITAKIHKMVDGRVFDRVPVGVIACRDACRDINKRIDEGLREDTYVMNLGRLVMLPFWDKPVAWIIDAEKC